ncbi:SDR family oxidoreductase [Aliivibrio logei]|uniref:NAD-dependent dehydratase n=1 Tax=Aliivibrio logei 5S-186 TaxID=626086 RepID=A0ABX3B023_ALILO|nr:SDR family oxidoreductase [Aliivibrio logei]OEF19693.1 NAD-dependent dehydratase [Aliivibrio logei 5S-186]
MSTRAPRILIAGSTGYLGGHIVKELLKISSDFKALGRNRAKLEAIGLRDKQMTLAEVTDAKSLVGCCDGIDVVISCVGITRQKDGLGYMDVDFQANVNLLREAEKAGVKKFIYISAFNAQKYKQVRLLNAKERFSESLLASTKLIPCVIRPNGFYADIEAFYTMAASGRAYVFGKGKVRLNPIHGEDLAHFCIEAIDKKEKEFNVGGSEVLSAMDIVNLAFQAQNKKPKTTGLPDWIRCIAVYITSKLPEKFGGPAEFFLTVMAQDMIAPKYGDHKLGEYFQAMFEKDK